jgi:hypothetical protein
MHDNPWRAPRLSHNAWCLMEILLRGGGGLRMGPLVRACDLSQDNLALAVNELAERWWIEIAWRGPSARRPGTLPDRFRAVRRVATTRIGRHCHPLLPRF